MKRLPPVNAEIPIAALDQLSALLLRRAGLKIAPDSYHSLRLAISTRMPAVKQPDANAYVAWLHKPQGEHELRSLLPLVTVGHTEFFRDARQFAALEDVIFPELLRTARRDGRQTRVWSAGCATGEEAYSLAIAALEAGAIPTEMSIYASDLNHAAVQSAAVGRYPPKRVVGMDPNRRDRYFTQIGDAFEVVPELKSFIRFDTLNLAAQQYKAVQSEGVDLILCRNVIIYFDLDMIRGVMDRFLHALRPGGYLLLGYSESLFKVYDKFEMVEVGGSFVYRKPPLGKAPRPLVPALAARSSPKPSIQAKSSGKAAGVPAKPPMARRRSPQERLASAVLHMEQGDFGAAKGALEQLCQDEPHDLDARLTLGNLYSLLGEDAQARAMFEAALAEEPLCADARLFGGVAALQAGRLEDAAAELGKALFLEPTLALGHYLLAQVLERKQQHEAARRAYRNAIEQVKTAQRPLAGHYPEIPETPDAIARAARYALAALDESPQR
ncbi:MAG: CheR family methyltransferase [Myxococcaceae bacterium]